MQTEDIDTTPMEAAGTDLVAQARALRVTNEDEAHRAGALLVSVKALMTEIKGKFEAPKAKAHQAHKAITGLEKEMLDKPTQAEAILKKSLSDWQTAEVRKRREEEAQLAAEARKREEDLRLKEAEELEAAGRSDLAEAVVDAPIAPPRVTIAAPKIAGVAMVTRKSYRVVDPSKVRREFLMLDESKIRAVVQSMGKDAEALVGGIVYEETEVPRVGGR